MKPIAPINKPLTRDMQDALDIVKENNAPLIRYPCGKWWVEQHIEPNAEAGFNDRTIHGLVARGKMAVALFQGQAIAGLTLRLVKA